MPCLDENAVHDFLLGKLAPTTARSAEEHLASCDPCRSLLEVAATLPDSAEAASAWLRKLRPESSGVGEASSGRKGPKLTSGSVVGARYVLNRPIGEGGMGIVWAARRTDTKAEVALKFLKSFEPDRIRRFRREARIMAELKHPNVVAVHEVVASEESGDEAPIIVMELLSGESLASLLRRRGALSVPETAGILLPMLSAIEAAHTAGVVHRDLKPENVFLLETDDGDRIVKVLDFGIAKRTMVRDTEAPTTTELTESGALIGTPFYMAPEQIFGDNTVDRRVDVWALGAVLYECLAGKRAIVGASFGQILKSITMGNVPSLALAVPDAPPEVCDLVARMMAREAADRPLLSEVAAVLARASGGAKIRTVRRGTPRVVVAGVAFSLAAVAVAVLAVAAGSPEKPAAVPSASPSPVRTETVSSAAPRASEPVAVPPETLPSSSAPMEPSSGPRVRTPERAVSRGPRATPATTPAPTATAAPRDPTQVY